MLGSPQSNEYVDMTCLVVNTIFSKLIICLMKVEDDTLGTKGKNAKFINCCYLSQSKTERDPYEPYEKGIRCSYQLTSLGSFPPY